MKRGERLRLRAGWRDSAIGLQPRSATSQPRCPFRRCRRGTRRHGRCGDMDAPPAQDGGRQGDLCTAKIYGGTSVWHHQTGDGPPPVPVAWIESRNGGMDAGLHCLQFEAASCAGSSERESRQVDGGYLESGAGKAARDAVKSDTMGGLIRDVGCLCFITLLHTTFLSLRLFLCPLITSKIGRTCRFDMA